LLRLEGAAVHDVAALLERERPDVLLMQKSPSTWTCCRRRCPATITACPGPAASTARGLEPHNFATPHILPLPASRCPGRLPQRRSQIVQVGRHHLRQRPSQPRPAAQPPPAAAHRRRPARQAVGDHRRLQRGRSQPDPGFADVGPREVTHFGGDVVPFRLDRCLAHCLGLHASPARSISAPSDHKPIVLDLQVAEARCCAASLRARAAAL
jgi:hypothetical protein